MVKGTLTGLSFCKGTYEETKGSNITNAHDLRLRYQGFSYRIVFNTRIDTRILVTVTLIHECS